MSLKRLLPRCDTSRSNKAERPMAPIWAPLRGCLKSPGRSRLTVQESGFVPAASRVEWRNIVGENDGIGTFQTPSEVVVDEGLTYRRDQVTIAVARYSPGVG